MPNEATPDGAPPLERRLATILSADVAVQLKLAAWTREGNPIDGVLAGRGTGDRISASGQWRDGAAVSGNWKRAR